MQEYIEMWKSFADFSGTTDVRGYWMAFLFNMIISMMLGVVITILEPLAFLSGIYALAVLIPALSIAVRRLNDAGYSWKSLLFYLVPFVGWIIVIVRLCKRSA